MQLPHRRPEHDSEARGVSGCAACMRHQAACGSAHVQSGSVCGIGAVCAVRRGHTSLHLLLLCQPNKVCHDIVCPHGVAILVLAT